MAVSISVGTMWLPAELIWSVAVLLASAVSIALCVCGRSGKNKSEGNKEEMEAVETRAVTYQESPQLANKVSNKSCMKLVITSGTGDLQPLIAELHRE
ncbi:hypothetical protein BIW11_05292 [Tropilaelaps mercedesae]|uniref:Uncharacterized protein n=1 Tax=Tropilaelaps mercedesae TaxID=418985 RepID=A0A1V9Y312_9ACAR|nr:hypothetical protein BIW11_05292 [Tropilaelaps mercedesae]